MEKLLFLFIAVSGFSDICKDNQHSLCTNCDSYVLVEGFCYKVCPDSYKQQGKQCEVSDSLIFLYNLSSNSEVLSSFKDQRVYNSDTSNTKSLLQTSQRGLFFKTESSKCLTKKNFLFGPKLVIVL